MLKTEEDVRMPAPESAEKPPESLEEGKKDIAQKAEGREVSKSEKLRAIRQVMKKKSSKALPSREGFRGRMRVVLRTSL